MRRTAIRAEERVDEIVMQHCVHGKAQQDQQSAGPAEHGAPVLQPYARFLRKPV